MLSDIFTGCVDRAACDCSIQATAKRDAALPLGRISFIVIKASAEKEEGTPAVTYKNIHRVVCESIYGLSHQPCLQTLKYVL